MAGLQEEFFNHLLRTGEKTKSAFFYHVLTSTSTTFSLKHIIIFINISTQLNNNKKIMKTCFAEILAEKNMKEQSPNSPFQGKRKCIIENSEIQQFEELDPIADQSQIMNQKKEALIKIITELRSKLVCQQDELLQLKKKFKFHIVDEYPHDEKKMSNGEIVEVYNELKSDIIIIQEQSSEDYIKHEKHFEQIQEKLLKLEQRTQAKMNIWKSKRSK